MANRKMIPPQSQLPEPPKLKKNPPPPKAMVELLARNNSLSPLDWQVTIVEDGIVLQFDTEIRLLLMTARGARQVAARLVEKTEELEKLNDEKSEGKLGSQSRSDTGTTDS